MNIDSPDKLDINIYTHNRTGSKTSVMDFKENDYKLYSHNRTTSKSSVADGAKYTHNRTGSKSSITNILGKRMGTFSRPVKINDRGSSLPRNNIDPHTHSHKPSHSNLYKNTNNDVLIQTRESSLLYSNPNNTNGALSNSISNPNINIPYSSHSRDNLNYLYHLPKHSPTSSPRDMNTVVMQVQSPYSANDIHIQNNKTFNTHYSPSSPKHSRDNHYQKDGYNRYNFHSYSKDDILKSSLTNKKMVYWTVNDVQVFLTENDLEVYKDIFLEGKIDGVELMKQNYETLWKLNIIDRVKLINIRNYILEYEKESEMINNNKTNVLTNNQQHNNQSYTQTLQRHDNLITPTKEIEFLKDEVYHNLTKSRSYESLTTNTKENEEIKTPVDGATFTLPRKSPINLNHPNFFNTMRSPNSIDKAELSPNKISTLSRTTSLKKKKLIKEESLNQIPIITPRSSSRNIEKNKLRRKHDHIYEGSKLKTPTSSGSKNTTPLNEKHFLFNMASSPNSAKDSDVNSNFMTYEEKLSPLHSAKSLTSLTSPSNITPIPKFLVRITDTKQTQIHTLDITNYTNEIKLWERIFTKFDIPMTKESFENYSLFIMQNGQKVPLSTNELMNRIEANESNIMIELILESKIKPKENVRPVIRNKNNKNIYNITETVNKSINSNIKLTSVPPKDKHNLLSNIKPEIRKKERLMKFFGERPPSMLICDQLEQFFPEVNREKSEKIKSIVMENIKVKRLSRLSRLSQSRSSFSSFDDQSIIGNISEDFEEEPNSEVKKIYYNKPSFQMYSIKTTPEGLYQKTKVQMDDHPLPTQEPLSSELPKKISIGDKRNSHKLSIITSPDKLKELSKNNIKSKVGDDMEGEFEINETSSSLVINGIGIEEEDEQEVQELNEEINDDIYTNEITDYSFSSELSADVKTIEELSNHAESRVSDSPSVVAERLNKLKDLINHNMQSMENDQADLEDEDSVENIGRSKRNGQYINKGPDNANIKRNTRSILGDIERYYNRFNNMKNLNYGNPESESEASVKETPAPSVLSTTTPSSTGLDLNEDSHSQGSQSVDDAITPKPVDKSVKELKRNYRAFKGISVMSVGRKSIYSMNLKQKLMPPETRFSITVPQKPIQWTRGPLIGQGSFSKVYHGLNTETGEIMAVKQVELCLPMSQENDEASKKKNQQMLDALYHEIKLLKDLNHENIVRYLGFELTETSSNVFLEYVSGGSVSSLIAKIGKFEEPLVKSLTSQIAAGMEYLHNRSIIHRDIKGANILVDEEGIAKISDFGISKKNEYEMAYKYNSRMSFQGSIFWMAPEVIRGKGYSAKVDIWSLGCVVLEMFTGVHPWKQYDEIQTVMYNLGMMNKPYIPKRLSPESQNLLNMCLDVNPEKRPTAKQLLAHSFCKPPEIPFDFKKYYQQAIEKVNRFDISAISNDITSTTTTSNSEMTSYDVTTELSTEEIITGDGITEEETREGEGLRSLTSTENPVFMEEPDTYENIIPKELKSGNLTEEEEEEEISDPHVSSAYLDPKDHTTTTTPSEKAHGPELKLENPASSSISPSTLVPLIPSTPTTLTSIGNTVANSAPVPSDNTSLGIKEEGESEGPGVNEREGKGEEEEVVVEEEEKDTIESIPLNNKSSSNATSTFSSFTLSLSLTSATFSSLSSSLSYLSSFDTTINDITKEPSEIPSGVLPTDTTTATTAATTLSSSEKEGEKGMEEKKVPPTLSSSSLSINTSQAFEPKPHGPSPSSSTLTYKLSNLSLSKNSEDSYHSRTQSLTSPILLTPRTPGTPSTPTTPKPLDLK